MERRETGLGSRWAGLLAPAAILAVGWLAWSNTLRNGFVYDDEILIVRNSAIRSLTPVSRFLKTESQYQGAEASRHTWRPLSVFSHALAYKAAGLDPKPYHLANVLLHLANSVLAYFLILALFGSRLTAFAASLVFLLHPAQTEAVAWASAQSNLLYVFFCLASWTLFLRSGGRSIAALLLFTLGLLSKESAASLPLLLALSVAWERNPAKEPRREIPWRSLAPYLALTLLYVGVRWVALGKTAQTGYWAGGLAPQLFTMAKGFVIYLRVALWPDPLSLEYLFPVKRFVDAEVLACGLVLAGLAWLGARAFRSRSPLGFGILAFFLALAPVSNIIPINTVINERYLYLPILGFGLALGALLELRSKLWRPVFAALCALFLVLTASRNLDWRDNLTLAGETLKTCPQASRAHSGLADALSRQGRFAEAIREYRMALAIDVFEDPLRDRIGQFDPWEPDVLARAAEYRRSLQLAVERPKILSNIGASAMRLGRHAQAAGYLEEALKLGATGPDTKVNLAVAHAQEGALDQAIAELESVLADHPGERKASHNLAVFREAAQTAFVRDLKKRFPGLRDRWTAISGLTYEETKDGVRPSAGLPAGLKAEEKQALAALAVREGRANRNQTVLPSRFGDPYAVRLGDSGVRIRPLEGRSAPAKPRDGVVLYPEAYPQTTVFYAASDSDVEEFYYLKSAEAPRVFQQELKGEGRIKSFSLTPEGKLAALDSSGGRVLELSRPLVMDSKGRKSHGRFSLEPRRGSAILALALDTSDLEFPVLIDPTWTTGASSMASPRYNHTATLLPSGKVLVAGGKTNGGIYLSTAELYDPAAGTWTTTGSMASARQQHAASLLPNGKVLVAGGEVGGGSYFSTAELYDPATGTWTTTGSMASERCLHTASLLPSGKILVVGGYNGSSRLSTAELYDPAGGTWTTTGSMGSARELHSATLLPNGKVLTAGGYSGSAYLATAELYDPAAGTWTTTGSMASPHQAHSATLLPNGKVMVAGGYDGGYVSATELYDPTAGTWTTTGSMASTRGYHAATLLPNGKVMVAGGTNNGITSFSTAELYDPDVGGWTTTGSMASARGLYTASLLPSGKVMVIGGYNNTGNQSTAEFYDPGAGSWSATGTMASARQNHSVTALPNGMVLVAGGFNGSYLSTSALYDPAAGTWTTTGSMGLARQNHSAVLLPDGKVLVAGGQSTGAAYLSTAELYDPAAGTWTTTGSMASVRNLQTATLLPNGKVLVAGGENAGGYIAGVELYDPMAGVWTVVNSMASARSEHTATLLPNGKVLVTGGQNSGGWLAAAELYDPAAGTWTTTGSLASARDVHTATLLPNGKVLVAGGTNGGWLSTAELYDPTSGIWTTTGSMGSARDCHTATLLPNSKVLVAGGWNGSVYHSTAEMFDPASGTWAMIGSMASTRRQHAATLLSNGKVLVAGGYNGSYLSTAELIRHTEFDFDISTKTFMRPGIATVNGSGAFPVTLNPGNTYTVTGTTFTGVGEASGGNYGPMSSPANAPRVYLMAQDSGGMGSIGGSGRLLDLSTSVYGSQEQTYYQNLQSSRTLDFTVPAGLACGYYSLHVMSNAILSTGAAVRIVPPAPSVAPSAGAPPLVGISSRSVTVQLVASAEQGLSGHLAQAALDAGFTNVVSTGFSITPSGTSATVYGLAPNTTHYFRAAAETCGGAGPFSASFGSTVTLASPPGSAVSTFTAVRFTSMTVNWSPNGNPVNLTTYTVVLSTFNGISMVSPATAVQSTVPAGGLLSASFTNLWPGTTYYLFASAVNFSGIPTAFSALGSTKTAGAGVVGVAGCDYGLDVAAAGWDLTSIQSAVGVLPKNLTGNACVVLRAPDAFAEQVTVQGFQNNGITLKIMAGPGLGSAPSVNPPALSTAAFDVRNASVSIAGISVSAGFAVPYGIQASSAYVTISSVNIAGGANVKAAGIMISSWSAISYSTVIVQAAHGIYLNGSTMTAVSYSTAQANSGSFYGLYLNGASGNSVVGSYVSNPSGNGGYLNAGFNNAIDLSTMTGGGGGFYALFINAGSTNTVSRSYIASPSGSGMYLNASANNIIDLSTVASRTGGQYALLANASSTNTVTRSYLSNSSGNGVYLLAGSNNNLIDLSTMTGGAGFYALTFNIASTNTVSRSYIANPAGNGVMLAGGSEKNTINLSTVASNGGAGSYALYIGGSSTNTVANSCLSNPSGNGVYLSAGSNSNTIDSSSITSNAAGQYALLITVSSTNTITRSYVANSAGVGLFMNSSANSNTIDLSTITGNGGAYYALYLLGGGTNTISRSFISNPSGTGAFLGVAAGSNTIDLSTITGNGGAYYALNITGSTNTVSRSFISNPSGVGASLDSGANSNTIDRSTLTSSGCNTAALQILNSSSNTVAGSLITNSWGDGAKVVDSSNTVIDLSTVYSQEDKCSAFYWVKALSVLRGAGNKVSRSQLSNPPGYAVSMNYVESGRIDFSTITNSNPTYPALYAYGNNGFAVNRSFIQGGGAVSVSQTTGTVIGGSSLNATASGWNALTLDQGSTGLVLSSSTLSGGSSGAGLYLENSLGLINVSSNTFLPGSKYGIYVATPAAGSAVWITSNTILATPSGSFDTYGVYLRGLSAGATVYDNAIMLRSRGSNGGSTAYGIYADGAQGLKIANNRISNPGMLSGGAFAPAYFLNSPGAEFLFNDVLSTGTGLATSNLVTLWGSPGARVLNNVFFSSVSLALPASSSATLWLDGASFAGFVSDYNDYFSSGVPKSSNWGGSSLGLLKEWQQATGRDAHSRSVDPLWYNPSAGVEDFHPLSSVGRWTPAGYVSDGSTSRTIDGGDPASPVGAEPPTNGGRVNQGSYGGTNQASKSVFPWPYDRYLIVLPGETYDAGLATGKAGFPKKVYVQQRFSASVRATDEFWSTDTSVSDNVVLTTAPAAPPSVPAGQASPAQMLAMSLGERTFNNVWFGVSSGPANVYAFHPTDGTKIPGLSSDFEILAVSSPSAGIDIPSGSMMTTLGGALAGPITDLVSVSGALVAIQQKGSPDYWFDWGANNFSSLSVQFASTTLNPGSGPSVSWRRELPDGKLAPGSDYLVVVKSTNPAGATGVGSTTFTFTTLGAGTAGGEGLAYLSSNSVYGCQPVTSTVAFEVGASGLGLGGKVAVRIPNGWTMPGGWAWSGVPPLATLPPSGTVYINTPSGPGTFSIELNPPSSGKSALGENWIVYTALAALAPGNRVYFVYTGMPPSGALGASPHSFKVMSQGDASGSLSSVPLSPVMRPLLAGPPTRLAIVPSEAISIGPLQTSATMQVELRDACGVSTVAISGFNVFLNAGREGELDANATFYNANTGAKITQTFIGAGAVAGNPAFYFQTSTSGASYEFVTATATIGGTGARAWASRFAKLFGSSVSLSGVSVDTGTPAAGAVTATMTGSGFDNPAFVNFTLSPPDVRWEVVISSSPSNWYPEVFHRYGFGDPGRTVAWNWIDERAYPPRAVAPNVYYVKIVVEGGLLTDASRRLYVNQSPSILGSLGAPGAWSHVSAFGPGTNYGNFALADMNGGFRIYGLEDGKAYNVTATTQVKTSQGQFMDLSVSSLGALATNAGTNLGALTLPNPGFLRVSAGIPTVPAKEIWGGIRVHNADYTRTAFGSLHYSTGMASSDDGSGSFNAAEPSTWTVIGLPPGTYAMEVEVPELGLSTTVAGVQVTGGARTDAPISLVKRANVLGLAVLPSTTAFGTWVSLQGIKDGDRYPSAFGGSFIPPAAPGVNPTSSTFMLFGLETGSWTVTAAAPGYVAASSRVVIPGSADVGGHLPGSLDLRLSSTGFVAGTLSVSGDITTVPGARDDPADVVSVFVNAYNPATFSRAGTRVRLKRNAAFASSTFTIAGLENGNWVMDAKLQGFSEGRSTVAVAGGRGAVSLALQGYDARIALTVILPNGPHAESEFRKVSAFFRGPGVAPALMGDLVEGSTILYWPDSAQVWSPPLEPGSYTLEAMYGANGMWRRVETALTDRTTAYVTMDMRGSTYTLSGSISLSGVVSFASATYAVSVSSIQGLMANAPTTGYCLMGSPSPVGISAAHMELLPIDMKSGSFWADSLVYSTSTTGNCARVTLPPGAGSAHPFLAYLAPISPDGTFSFPKVAPGPYLLRNSGEIDLNPVNGDELAKVSQVVMVSSSIALAPLKIESGVSVAGTVYLPPQTAVSRSLGVELLDQQGRLVRSQSLGVNNTGSATYVFDRLPQGSYAVVVRDLDFPRMFGAPPKAFKLAGSSLAGVDVYLQRTGVIKGRIALQTRLPDGATGPYLLISNRNANLLPASFRIEAKASPWFQGGFRRAASQAGGQLALDGSDQFVVEDLLPGKYDVSLLGDNIPEHLRAGAMALVPMVLPAVQVEAGRISDVGTAEIVSAVELRGRVRDAAGAGVPNLPVEALPAKREGDAQARGQSRALTDRNGDYVLYGLSPVVRYYDVYAAARPPDESVDTYVAPYEQKLSPSVDLSCTTALDFSLTAAPYAAAGRVVPPSGGGALSWSYSTGRIPAARVFLQRTDLIPTRNPIADIEAFTNAEGVFSIRSLTPGTYRLTAASIGYGSKTRIFTIGNASVSLGTLTLDLGATLSGGIRKPDGSYPSQDEVKGVMAANSDMSDIVKGTLETDENSKTVTGYSIAGFKPGVRYTLVIADRRNNIIGPDEASYLVFASSAESRSLDLAYRLPKPAVFAKARRSGGVFRLEFSMTAPLRKKKDADDDYASILTTCAARGSLSQFELSSDRTRLSAVYTPLVSESSFTLRVDAYSAVPDPDSLDPDDPEFRLQAVATFYAGIDGMHQNQMGNVWGGNLLIEGDQGRITIPSGAFDAGVSSNVEVSMRISSESLTRFGVSDLRTGGPARGRLRFGTAAYPDELLRAMESVPPQVNPLSAFYNIMLPLGLRTALSRPVQLTVTYSSGTDPATLNLYWYNPAANTYVLQQDVTGANPVIDTVNRTITVNINHFSTFVLFNTGVSVITGDAFSGTEIQAFNFPNPFDLQAKTVTTIHPNAVHTVRGTLIRFSLSSGVSGDASIRIYSVTGERVRTLDLGFLTGGKFYYQDWDGRNDSGRDVASGVYVGQIRVGKRLKSFKMALIK